MKIITIEIENEIETHEGYIVVSAPVSFVTKNKNMEKISDKDLIDMFISQTPIIAQKEQMLLEKLQQIKDLLAKRDELDNSKEMTAAKEKRTELNKNKNKLQNVLSILSGDAKKEVLTKITKAKEELAEISILIEKLKADEKSAKQDILDINSKIMGINSKLQMQYAGYFFDNYFYDFKEVDVSKVDKHNYVFKCMQSEFIEFLLANDWTPINFSNSINKNFIKDIDFTASDFVEYNPTLQSIFKA